MAFDLRAAGSGRSVRPKPRTGAYLEPSPPRGQARGAAGTGDRTMQTLLSREPWNARRSPVPASRANRLRQRLSSVCCLGLRVIHFRGAAGAASSPRLLFRIRHGSARRRTPAPVLLPRRAPGDLGHGELASSARKDFRPLTHPHGAPTPLNSRSAPIRQKCSRRTPTPVFLRRAPRPVMKITAARDSFGAG